MITSFLNWLYVGSSPTEDTNIMSIPMPASTLNMIRIMRLVRARLNKLNVDDKESIHMGADIFSTDMLVNFIELSISQFNQTPYFTFFTISDTEFVNNFINLLVDGVVLAALASCSLIEKGYEFKMDNNGVNFATPSLSELLTTQWSKQIELYHDQLKEAKREMNSSRIKD